MHLCLSDMRFHHGRSFRYGCCFCWFFDKFFSSSLLFLAVVVVATTVIIWAGTISQNATFQYTPIAILYGLWVESKHHNIVHYSITNTHSIFIGMMSDVYILVSSPFIHLWDAIQQLNKKLCLWRWTNKKYDHATHVFAFEVCHGCVCRLNWNETSTRCIHSTHRERDRELKISVP